MLLRRARIALFLVVALAAMALVASVEVGGGSTSRREASGEVSIAVRAARADGSFARLTGDDRRDTANAERTLKQRLIFAAVLTAVLCAAFLSRRGAVVHGRCRRPVTSLWSPRAGRSPPFQLSIV